MELTSERKAEILKEEAANIAEEQYRQQIRTGMRSRKIAVAPSVIWGGAVAVALVAFALVGWIASHNQSSQGTSEINTPSESNKVPHFASRRRVDSIAPLKPVIPPAPASPQKLTTAEISQRDSPSVFVVENYNQDGQIESTGSGYVFGQDGSIATNYHVVRGAFRLAIHNGNNRQLEIAHVLGYDPQRDVAILKADTDQLPALKTVVTPVQVGDRVVAIGAPLRLENSVSEGIVSALRSPMIQTTAAISHGSSGGPLLNEFGEVIGLTTAIMEGGEMLNLAVPSSFIIELSHREHSISLETMREQTFKRTRFPGSVSIQARGQQLIPFTVDGQARTTLEGSFTISGGSGNDAVISLVQEINSQPRVLQSSRYQGSGLIKRALTPGKYALFFDNRFSAFSKKSVALDLSLSSYR